jgi:hypothetical protein
MFCYIHPEILAETLRLFDRKKTTLAPAQESPKIGGDESGIDKTAKSSDLK